ncbi:MAG: ubiquinone/menaquinone biosynthesis methyltransferase [Alkalispirochaeta sp.]
MKNDTRLPERMAEFSLGEPRSKRDYNRRLFRVVAIRYDLITRLLSFGQDRYWKAVLLRRVTGRRPGEILDVACGTGDLAINLALRLPEARVMAMDLTPEMLHRARRRAARRGGRAGTIHFHQGDMGELFYEANQFDLVTAGYALRNAPDLATTVTELRRVLRPDGVLGILDFSRSDTPAISSAQVGLLRLWGRIWGRLLHGNPDAYGYIAESLRRFPARSQFLHLLRVGGFGSVSEQRFFFGIIAVIIARP